MQLINFLIVLIGLAVIGAIAYVGSEKSVRDATLKQIGQYAFVGIAVIIALYAAGAVLFGAGNMIVLGPHQIIDFAIGMVFVLVVLFLLHLLADYALTGARAKAAAPVNYVLDAVAVLAILFVAGKAFFGGGLGLIPPGFGRVSSLVLGIG
jgi:hypothetical protein